MTNPVENEEGLVVRVTETISTLALLNVYWLISSLLLVPSFAATEALFYCVNEHMEHRQTNLRRVFFDYVKTNLSTSLKRQIIPFFILLVVLLDTLVIYSIPFQSQIVSLGRGMFLFLSLLIYFIFMYQLSFLFTKSRNHRSLKSRVMHSFYIVVRYPQYTISLILILILYLLVSLYFVPLFIFFGLSFPAFCFSFAVTKIHQKSRRMD